MRFLLGAAAERRAVWAKERALWGAAVAMRIRTREEWVSGRDMVILVGNWVWERVGELELGCASWEL